MEEEEEEGRTGFELDFVQEGVGSGEVWAEEGVGGKGVAEERVGALGVVSVFWVGGWVGGWMSCSGMYGR